MSDGGRVSISYGSYSIGQIVFARSSNLKAERAADGVLLSVPTRITVNLSESGQRELGGLPMLSEVRVSVRHAGLVVGAGTDPRTYSMWTNDAASEIPLHLSGAAIASIERSRNGGPPEFQLEFTAQVCLVVDGSGPARLRSEPYPATGSVLVTYDRDAWVNMLKSTGFGETVIVEIRLPASPPAPWDEVWKALRSARDSLARGGEAGWKGAIVDCRHALEDWQKIEREDHGPGWNPPDHHLRQQRTWKQRLDNVRWDLLQCAHEAAHTHPDEWTRDDAILVLGALSGLLAVRKP